MTPITIRTGKGYRTEIAIRQHTVIADELISDNGTDTGPTPMELLVGSAAACVAVTTKAYAERKAWPLEGVSVEIEMERIKREDYPAYTGDALFVHQVHEKITFEGPLTDEQRTRLLAIAGKCPVHATLANPVFFDQQLVEPTPQ